MGILRIGLTLILGSASPLVGAELFSPLYQVASSPRCVNCHGDNDTPRQLKISRVHSMAVTKKLEGLGMDCTTCHRSQNGTTAGSPPGAVGWHMPPGSMALVGLNARQVCQLWRDPSRNGGRSAEDLIHHVEEDALIRWTWNPGQGRKPPVGTHAEFVSHFKEWVRAGMPCP